jgi:hypothetical protein
VWCDAASGGTALKFEPVQYNATYGDFENWFQLPVYHTASDDSAYLFVGKSSVTTVQEDLSMWCDINYQVVLHHPNGSTLDLLNSGCLAGSVTNNSTVAAKGGMAGGAAYFDGTNNRNLEITDSSTLRPSGALSLETWISAFQYNGDRSIIAKAYRNTGSWASPFLSYSLYMLDGKIGTYITTSGSLTGAFSSSSMDRHTWNLVSGTFDSANSVIKTYINGANVATTSKSGTIDYNGGITSDPVIGTSSAYNDVAAYVKGVVDETRIATDVKSGDWYATAAASGNPNCSNYQIQDATFSKPQLSQFCSNALLSGGESVALPFTAGTHCTFGGSANCVLGVAVIQDDDNCASTISATLSGTPFTIALTDHSQRTGTIHSYDVCTYIYQETGSGSLTVTAPSTNNSMWVGEFKGATTTGMVTENAGNNDQPHSMSGTSPAADTMMLCMVRGNDTPDGATIGGVTIPAASAANLFGPFTQSDHYAVAHVAYGLVGSGTQSCTLDSGPGGVMVMLPKI